MPDTPKTPEVEDLIRYDILAQEALRSVVKKVLQEVARTGLPGDHHFYITFDTQYAGVRMSSRMREKYPEEMTIVVQHQFWDLETTDHGFSIGLSFDNIPEALSIPFAAIRGFFDPSVQFGLQFEAVEEDADSEADSGGAKTSALPSPPDRDKITDESSGDGGENGDGGKRPDADDSDEETSAEVVSLDAFRKK
jgi:hypothetical protein